jgi:hypothetical protein
MATQSGDSASKIKGSCHLGHKVEFQEDKLTNKCNTPIPESAEWLYGNLRDLACVCKYAPIDTGMTIQTDVFASKIKGIYHSGHKEEIQKDKLTNKCDTSIPKSAE